MTGRSETSLRALAQEESAPPQEETTNRQRNLRTLHARLSSEQNSILAHHEKEARTPQTMTGAQPPRRWERAERAALVIARVTRRCAAAKPGCDEAENIFRFFGFSCPAQRSEGLQTRPTCANRLSARRIAKMFPVPPPRRIRGELTPRRRAFGWPSRRVPGAYERPDRGQTGS
jgi:hypothetical protein